MGDPKIRVSMTFEPSPEDWNPDSHTGLTDEAGERIALVLASQGFQTIEFTRQGDT